MKATFKTSRRSMEDYFLWRIERSRPLVTRINSIQSLKDLKILDLGCGCGPLAKVLGDFGARVTAAEVDKKLLNFARKFLSKNKKIKVIEIGKEKLPFQNSEFDIVFLFDVIEHVKNPAITIAESKRVLKNGGLLIVLFTPYYSIVGHHLYDYTKFPVHILPQSMVKKMIYSKRVQSFFTKDEFWDLFATLNKLKISEFQKRVKDLKKLEEKFIIKYPELFEVNIPIINLLGPIKDFFTMSFEGIYQKK